MSRGYEKASAAPSFQVLVPRANRWPYSAFEAKKRKEGLKVTAAEQWCDVAAAMNEETSVITD
jgi:hypothetical protein